MQCKIFQTFRRKSWYTTAYPRAAERSQSAKSGTCNHLQDNTCYSILSHAVKSYPTKMSFQDLFTHRFRGQPLSSSAEAIGITICNHYILTTCRWEGVILWKPQPTVDEHTVKRLRRFSFIVCAEWFDGVDIGLIISDGFPLLRGIA